MKPTFDLAFTKEACERWTAQLEDEFLAKSHEKEEVREPSSTNPAIDKNNIPLYGVEMFDIAVANILLKEYTGEPVSANVAEMITRLGYEGLRHCCKEVPDAEWRKFCSDIALNKVPDLFHLLSYILWLERYRENNLPNWFYYTLPMWCLLDDRCGQQFVYRSRMLVNYCLRYDFTRIGDLNAERTHDVLRIRPMLVELLYAAIRHCRTDHTSVNTHHYLLSTLREFSILTLATMMTRRTQYEVFMPLAWKVKLKTRNFHQAVVDKNYKTNKEK